MIGINIEETLEELKAGNDASILVIFKRLERFITILTSKEFLEFEDLELEDIESRVS